VRAAGGLFGGKKRKDKEEEPADPEKQLKVEAALAHIDQAEKAAAASEKVAMTRRSPWPSR